MHARLQALKFLFQLPIFCLTLSASAGSSSASSTAAYTLSPALWYQCTPRTPNAAASVATALTLVQPLSLFGLQKYGVEYGGHGFIAGAFWDLVVLLSLLLHRRMLGVKGVWKTSKHADDHMLRQLFEYLGLRKDQAVVMTQRILLTHAPTAVPPAAASSSSGSAGGPSTTDGHFGSGHFDVNKQGGIATAVPSASAEEESEQPPTSTTDYWQNDVAPLSSAEEDGDEDDNSVAYVEGMGGTSRLPAMPPNAPRCSRYCGPRSGRPVRAYLARTDRCNALLRSVLPYGAYLSLLRSMDPATGAPHKPGRDLYIYTFLLQFVTLLYIIFAFTYLSSDAGSIASVSQQLQYNQFSGSMVLAALAHIVLMVLDRVAYLLRSNALKCVLQAATTFIIHIAVFLVIPTNTGRSFGANPALVVFYLLWAAYLVVGGVQIHHGFGRTPPRDSLRSSGYNSPLPLLFNVYLAIPFLHELRQILDWVW